MAIYSNGQVGWHSGVVAPVTPSIVTNGLILNLDAGNASSYPGSGTLWTDLSGQNNNGTLVNGVGYSSANGGALTFDGVNDYIDLGSQTSFNLTNMSISIWVKMDNSITSNSFIAGRYHNTNSDNGWHISYNPTTQKFKFDGRESAALYISNETTNNYNKNTWYNITGTKSANTWSIYVNGVLDTTQNVGLGNVAFLSNQMQLGGMVTFFGSFYSKCSIGNTLMYNKSLSSSEVLQNFNATKTRFGL